MDEINIRRLPWRMEKSSAYKSLYDVLDCDGNIVVPNKIREVAELIVDGSVARAELAECRGEQLAQMGEPALVAKIRALQEERDALQGKLEWLADESESLKKELVETKTSFQWLREHHSEHHEQEEARP